jgi:hypothetical protein
MLSNSVSTTIKVAEFMNVETGEHFDTTVSPSPEGFVIDEDVAAIDGPFFTFADGVVGLFKGICDRAAI